MKAVILAGGKGTRMGNLTSEIPKPMLSIGNKPLLEHQVELCKKYAITEIIIIVNHLKDVIVQYFGNGAKWGVDIRYYEEPKPLGTVGGIKEVEEWLQSPFLVIYGDVMVNMDLSRLQKFHEERGSECTLVLHPNDHPHDSDLVELALDGRITAFYPKPHTEGRYYKNMVNAGLYVFEPALLKFLEKGKKADFGREVFPAIFDKIRMFGYNTAEFLKDMGTPERLEEVNKAYYSGKIDRSSYEFEQKAIFLDRDGVINHSRGLVKHLDEFVLYDFAAKAVQKINKSGYISVVVTNQPVIARNLCTVEELEEIHRKMETELGQGGAKLDFINYCPHHPDKGYPGENPAFKIDCNCRKPKPGMLLKAAKEAHIDLANSFMIGDAERDILAGKAAGCLTVGVRTGEGLKTTQIQPDFMFQDLAEAVDFIVDDPMAHSFNKVYDAFVHTSKRPFVIVIAGNSRSGKSNFTSYLNWKFNAMGHRALPVHLDHWILPEEKRTPEMNVYERFQLSQLETDVLSIINGLEIQAPGYASHPERNVVPQVYKYSGEDVIIIEGIVALGMPRLMEIDAFRIYMHVSPDILKQRFLDFYRWKGKSDADIEILFEKRQRDEFEQIEKDANFTHLIIDA